MTNPSIKVGAQLDTASVEAGLKKIKAATEEINKSLTSADIGFDFKKAKADLAGLAAEVTKVVGAVKTAGGSAPSGLSEVLGDAHKAAADLETVLEHLGQSTGMAGTVKNAKDLTDHLTRARRAQEAFGKDGIRYSKDEAVAIKARFDELKKQKMRGTGFIRDMHLDDYASGGWRNYSLDEAENKRMRRRLLGRMGVNLPNEEKAAGSGNLGRYAARFGGAAAGVVSGVASGGGFGMGAMIGGAAGLIPGVGMVLGPVLGALGGVIDKALERAIAEAGDLTDLRHSLGSTSVDFDRLRDTVRHFSDGLGVSYNEAAKLAKQFAHTANSVGDADVGRQSGNAIGFARGFGMDPSAAVQFFATMRHYGVSQGEGDSRKLALMIAEAIGKGGISPKADEAMAAIQSYVQTASRQSLTEANVGAYASFMSSLTGLKAWGVNGDPEAAAAMMGKADAALRQGGAFGEASKNFSLGIYQRMLPGFNSFDMDYLNEQGAFGTMDRAFGKDSRAYAFAKARGDHGKMRQYDQWAAKGGDQSIISYQMRALEQFYGGNTDAFRKAISTHLGVGAGEASALYQAYKSDNGLGSLEKSLKGAGVDVGSLTTKQIAALAQISTGGPSAIQAQAKRLLDPSMGLSQKEKDELTGAKGQNLEKVVLRLTALHDVTEDEGEKMRRLQADMANKMQELATKLIPLAGSINSSLLELVKKFVPESKLANAISGEEGAAGVYDPKMDDLRQKVDHWDPHGREKVKKRRDDAMAKANDAKARGDLQGYSDWMFKAGAADAELSQYPASKRAAMENYNKLWDMRAGLHRISPYEHGKYDLETGSMGAAPTTSGGNGARLNGGGSGGGRQGHALRGSPIDPNTPAGRLAQRLLAAGMNVTATTNHSEYVKGTHRRSEHPGGNAVDFVPVGGMGSVSKAQTDQLVSGMLDELGLEWSYGTRHKRQFLGPGDPGHSNHFHAGVRWKHQAMNDVNHNVRVIVVDKHGNEMGNAVSHVQTRAGAPVPSGMAYG